MLIHLAETAFSVATFRENRFVMWFPSGDRYIEYPAFPATFDNRDERFRESTEMIKVLVEQTFSHYQVSITAI